MTCIHRTQARLLTRAVAGVVALSVVVAFSEEVSAAPPKAKPSAAPLFGAVAVSPEPVIDVSLGGWARTRFQWFQGADLGNAALGKPMSLASMKSASSWSQVGSQQALTDVRVRFEPRVTVSQKLSVAAQVDLGGGALTGVDADGPRWFEGDGRDATWLAVRRAWADLDLFGLATLRVGRVGDHFGLGAWRNDGRDRFNDWQSDVDRVALHLEVLGLRWMLSRDLMASLPMTVAGLQSSASLQDSTDVVRWMLQVQGGALRNGRGIRWGVAVSYQDQSLGMRLEHESSPLDRLTEGCVEAGTCAQLIPRGAMLITPQGFIDWRKNTSAGFVVGKAEAVVRFGTLDNADVLVATDTSKVLISAAAVGELSLTRGAMDLSLRAGWASGDDQGGFGVRDKPNFTALDPVTKQVVQRGWLTGMALHRGFLVDGLLFREVIGAVANAAYARPAWRWRPLANPERLTVELGCLFAWASQSGATPGRASWLGWQPELRLKAGLGRLGELWINGSALMPGDALRAGSDGPQPTRAWRTSAVWLVQW